MASRLRILLLAALLATPAPLLAQTTVLGDTAWVAAPAGAVGRVITVAFGHPADRSAILRDEIRLPVIDGQEWRAQDLLVALDVGTRAPEVTWRVVGPAFVIDVFEAEVRKLADRRPTTRGVAVRPLVVR